MTTFISKRFLSFGCWNYLTYGDNNPLTKVIDSINNFVNNNFVDFICISGDNYYNRKQKIDDIKIKTFIKSDVFNSFNALPNNIPIYLLMGNHEISNNTNLFIQENNNSEPFKAPLSENIHNNCSVLREELDVIQKLNNFIIDSYDNEYILHNILNDNTLIMMIDTTMYDLEINEYDENNENDINDVLCYKLLFDIPSNINSPLDILNFVKNKQHEKINNLLKELNDNGSILNIKNVVIIGHHPIIYHKIKNTKLKTETLTNIYDLFYYGIFDFFKQLNVNFYYLCADLHNFQAGNIVLKKNNEPPMFIKQYISGTGGASPDTHYIINRYDNNFFLDNTNYQISYEVFQSEGFYGFLDCRLNNDILEIDFIFVENQNSYMLENKIKESSKKDNKRSKENTKENSKEKNSKKKSKGGKKSKKLKNGKKSKKIKNGKKSKKYNKTTKFLK